jgi:hypothetical protein
MKCEVCESGKNIKFRGDDYGVLCDDCYEEQYDAVHLDDDEDEE